MKLKRDIAEYCLNAAKQYPIITVTGQRQAGKNTLVRDLFKNFPYLNMEEPDTRALTQKNPRAILNKYPKHLMGVLKTEQLSC